MPDPRLSVLHFSTADRIGGSAMSAWRIHSGLLRRGHESNMLVGQRSVDDARIETVTGDSAVLRLGDKVGRRLGDISGLQYAWLPSSHRVLRHRWVEAADVIQLYNTHGGYFSQWLIPALAARKPLVWRLSDMWPMTGHCAYSGDCERWRTGCGSCPQLAIYPALRVDTTRQLFDWKRSLYARSDIHVVAPSSWIGDAAAQSPLLGRFPISRIPNGIDGTVFRPADRAAARRHLGLPETGTFLLFCAHILEDNERKGGDHLIEALALLARSGRLPADARLLLLGEGGESWIGRVPLPVHLLGFRTGAAELARVYAAADLLALPSLVENLPNVLIEALGCGLPSVAYDTGGMRDGVRDGVTGLLVPTGDVAGFAEAVARLLNSGDRRMSMAANARALFEAEFGVDVEIDRFETLYQELAAPAVASRRVLTA